MNSIRNLFRSPNLYRAALSGLALTVAACDAVKPGGTIEATAVTYQGRVLAIDAPPVNGTPAVRFMCKDTSDPTCADKVAATGDSDADRWHKYGTGIGNAAAPFTNLGAALATGPAGVGTSILVEGATAIGRQVNPTTNATNSGTGNTINLNYNLEPIRLPNGRVIRFAFPDYNKA